MHFAILTFNNSKSHNKAKMASYKVSAKFLINKLGVVKKTHLSENDGELMRIEFQFDSLESLNLFRNDELTALCIDHLTYGVNI